MEVNNIRIEQAARLLIDNVKDDNKKKEEQDKSTNTDIQDVVEIENENLLAANIIPTSIKEASKLIRDLKFQLLENPEAALDAHKISPNIMGLL